MFLRLKDHVQTEMLNSRGFRLPALDGLRGIAIIEVLLCHAASAAPGISLFPGGILGVETFFVLSGFLICSMLIREWHTTGSISLPQFYIRRAWRLLPALLSLHLFALVFAASNYNRSDFDRIVRGVLSSLFYYSNWMCTEFLFPLDILTHVWSLSVEEQFYFLFPPLMLLFFTRNLGSKTIYLLLAGLALTSWALLSWHYVTVSWLRAYWGSDSRFGALLVGALAALLIEKNVITKLPRPIEWAALVVVIVSFSQTSPSGAFFYYGGGLIHSVAIAFCIIATIVRPDSVLTRMLSFSGLRFMGKISYSLYLWNFPVAVFFTRMMPEPTLWLINSLIIATSVLVGTISYVWIELPWMRRRIAPPAPCL